MTENVLVGRKIVEIREMTDEELDREGWSAGGPPVIVLEDGTTLFPAADQEGEGAGVLLGAADDRGPFRVEVEGED